MIQRVNREQPFQVLASNFSIGPSNSGYDLEISADGVNYTTLFSVGANVTRMVTGVANGSYYRLGGNTDDDVAINWRTQCNDGQGGGGGGAGSQGPQGTAGAQGYQGPSNSGYKISLSTHAYENYTQEDIAAVNAFLASVSADSATLNGAYVVVGGNDYFYLSRYEEGYVLFGDTNNGYIHSISWNFDPETAEITDGEYVVNTIPEGGGDSTTLQAVIDFNPDAQFGDVQAKYVEVGNEVVVEGELFDDGIDLTGKNVSYIYVDNANGVEFSAEGGRWSISWANDTFNLNLIDGEDNITGVYTIETKGDSEEGYDINILDGEENGVWNMFIDKAYEINDNGFGYDYTVPEGTEGNVNYTYTDYHNEIDGLYQYDGTDWNAVGGEQGYKIELSTNNPEDFTEDDIDNLDAFGAAFEEDNTISEGAYIMIDGYKYSFNSYEEGEGTIIMYFEQLTSTYVDELVITFDGGSYVSAESNATSIGEQPVGDSHILKGSSAIPQTESNDVFSIALQYPDVKFGTWTDNEATDQWWSENGGDRAIKYDTTANTYWMVVIDDTWYNMSYHNGEVKSQEGNVNYIITKYDDGKWVVSDARYTFFVEVSDAIYIYTLLDKGFHHCEGENNIYSTNEMTINSTYKEDGIYRAKAEKELIAAPSNASNATGENRTIQIRVYANPRNNTYLGSAADTFGNVYEIWLGAGGQTTWMTLSGASAATATAELGGSQVFVSAISGERMGFTFKYTTGSSYNTIQAQGSSSTSKFNRNLNLKTYEDYIDYHRVAEDWELPNETRLVPLADDNGKFLLSHTTGGSYWESVSFVQGQEIGETDEEGLNAIRNIVDNDPGRCFEALVNKVYWMNKPQIDAVNGKVYNTNVMLRPISVFYDVENDMSVLNIKVDWTHSGDEMTIPMTNVLDNESQEYQLMFLNTASTAGNYIIFGEAAQPAWQCNTSIVDSAGTILFASSWSNDEVTCSAATGISYAIRDTDIVVEGFEAGATYTWSYTGADELGETFMYRIPKRIG